MSDKITAQLETIFQTLASVESRLKNLEQQQQHFIISPHSIQEIKIYIFERVSGLEKSINSFGREMSKLDNKTKEIGKTASDVDTAMAFVNRD